MTQEDKQLLLKDLSARLPYHPKGHVVNACNGAECDEWLTCATFPMFTSATNNCRLYLRPMSSMTKEERNEYHSYCDYYYGTYFDTVGSIDWLNKKMFDYHKDDEGKTMIEKGLALEAPDGMYKHQK